MIDKKLLKIAFSTPLEREDFFKKGQSWYFNGQDSIVEVNLQKNDWTEAYFINIEIWLKALETIEFPPKHECHISSRAEQLFSKERETIIQALSLENSNSKLLAKLSEFIGLTLVPFIRECSYKERLTELLANGTFKSALIRKDAKVFLRKMQ
jgi:Domain of unknown function (DUF4304)